MEPHSNECGDTKDVAIAEGDQTVSMEPHSNECGDRDAGRRAAPAGIRCFNGATFK